MNKKLKTISKILFPEKIDEKLSAIQKFENELKQKCLALKSPEFINIEHFNENDFIFENSQEIADCIKSHVISVGKTQAIKDFQCGLNFLHKNLIEPLKEDGDFGKKTLQAFYEIFKYYEIDVIKNAIRKGAISNTVISTASNKNIDMHKLLMKIEKNLGGLKLE